MDLPYMHDVAVGVARRAGEFALAEFDGDLGTEAKGDGADVVTRVDVEAERRMIAELAQRFPEHAILGEESGAHGRSDAPVRWLIDPLDGTNNYVLGLPSFGVCLTACVQDEPVVAVVHNSVSGVTTSATAGGGARRTTATGTRVLRIEAGAPLEHTTVSWSQGYGVGFTDEFRTRAMAALEGRVKRVLRTWSPSVDWGLVAQGSVGAIALYRNEIWDMVGGLLLVTEAGGVVHRQRERDCVIAGRPQDVEALAELMT